MQFSDYSITMLAPDESERFFELIDSNRARLEDFFAGTVKYTTTLEATRDYCDLIARRIAERSYFPFIVRSVRTGDFIGLVDVKNIDWTVPKAEIGYFIDREYEGQGVTSRALSCVVDHVVREHGFRKLLCRVNDGNMASARVALKNGFELEGTIRRDYVTTSGEVVDLGYYGRVLG